MSSLRLHTSHEDQTYGVGVAIGALTEAGDILALWGELGAGKTLLARGIARGLGVPSHIPITSPTFTFINEYDGRLHLYHLDLYRLSNPEELETLPWKEAVCGEGVAVIEWPDRLGEELPDERWDVQMIVTDDESRTIVIEVHGEREEERLRALAGELDESIKILDE
jgi:tRNA threonylcarbamoyladenosine biosynthesis protein TsaE